VFKKLIFAKWYSCGKKETKKCARRMKRKNWRGKIGESMR